MSVAQRVWDTGTLPENDQWSFWRDVVWDAFVPVGLERRTDGPFRSRVAAASLGGLGVSRITSAAQSVTRTTSDIARRTGGTYFLNLPLAGEASAAQRGRVAELRPGDFALVDSEAEFELDYGGPFDQISLMIPHELLSPLLAAPEDATAVRVPGDSGIGAMASAAIRTLVREAPALDRRAAAAAAGHVAGLVALAVRGLSTSPVRASRRLLLDAAMDEISASLADPDLSPPVVAARIAISVRYLHRLFAEQGTTFGRVLLQRRLVEVRRKLADPTFDHLTITELALAAGFSDPAHFSRAFKAAFGMTALAFRRSA